MKRSISELYQSGKDLFEAGKYVEAEPILREVLKLNPNYADVLNKLGVIAYLNSGYEEATEYFEQALQINPSYTEASLNLSITYNALGKFKEAEDVLSLAAQIAHPTPTSLDPFTAGKLANEHYKIGNLYLDLGMYDEAIEEYNRALKLHPSASDILTKLGIALRYKGKYEDAVMHFLRAKEKNPDYGPAWVQLGITFYMKGLIGNAIEEWEKALEHNPNLNEARTYLRFIRKKEEQ